MSMNIFYTQYMILCNKLTDKFVLKITNYNLFYKVNIFYFDTYL